MKILFISTTLLLAFTIASCGQIKTGKPDLKRKVAAKSDLEIDGLKGKVKSVRTALVYEYKDEQSKERLEGPFFSMDENIIQIDYDRDGNQTESNQYYPSGILNYKTKFTRDRYGNILETSLYYADDSLRLIEKSEYTYDIQGDNIEIGFDLDYLNVEEVYDTLGNFSGSTWDKINGKSKSIYDIYGNEIEERNYDSNDSLINTVKYTYNSQREKIEERYCDTNDSLINTSIYTYDGQGNILSINKYDSDGRLTRTGKMNYTCDNLTVKTEMVWYDLEGKLVEKEKHTYEYDTLGNWIKRTTSFTEFDKQNEVREIEYY